jgi:hypothetical protein
MDPAQMLARCPHSPQRGTGWLEGWRLTFGGEDVGWDGALTTVVEDPAQRVFVVLYDVPEIDEKELDTWDGVTLGYYRKLKVRVQTLDGDVLAWLYVLDAYEGGLPSARHIAILVDSAIKAGAPVDYVQWLRTRPSNPPSGTSGDHIAFPDEPPALLPGTGPAGPWAGQLSQASQAPAASQRAWRSSAMFACLGEHEPVLRELGDKGVDHARQVTLGGGANRPLPISGRTGLQHLGRHGELLGAAEPPRYWLQFAEQLVYLIPERGRRPRVIRDHDRVESVPRGAPLVVGDHPGGPGRQPVAAVQLGIEELDKALH